MTVSSLALPPDEQPRTPLDMRGMEPVFLSEAARSGVARNHGMVPQAEPHPLPILVVDDDPALRKLLQAGLKDRGYTVETAASVSAARACLRTRPYSLVLSDYNMPGGNGLDLLAYVSGVYPDLPFIMLTAHDEVPLARRAIVSGALDFLPKPFKLSQLVRLIEQNRARLARDRERTAALTSEVLTGTIRALVAAVDAKDPHTANHSERAMRLALRLGEAVGLSEEQLRILEFAALLHDVGKIGVPEAILQKPGPLDEAEWAVMKQHPIRSAQIVGEVAQLAEVAAIVRHHHEWVDGTGYPDALVGEAIPFLARLLTIADSYEAMTSHRAYRPALTAEQAREVIRRGLGTQFDPEPGAAFLLIRDLP